MNYAYLFAGLAAGSIIPWVIMFVILRAKDTASEEATKRANIPNLLLEERNEIGEREARALTGINATLALADMPTRRERIATVALNGYLAGRTHDTASMPSSDDHHRYVAESCLKYADALIVELDGKITHENSALDALHVIRTVATKPHHPNALEAIRQIAEREITGVPRKEEA